MTIRSAKVTTALPPGDSERAIRALSERCDDTVVVSAYGRSLTRGGMALLLLVGISALVNAPGMEGAGDPGTAAALATLALALALAGILFRLLAQRVDLTPLARVEDYGALGAVAAALASEHAGLRRESAATLIRMLAAARPQDLESAGGRERLFALLDPRFSAEFDEPLMALLNAVERAGDCEALPGVRRLALGPAAGSAQERVRAEARRLLPELASRSKDYRHRRTLMRASEMPPERLVRPASRAALEPQTLVRPHPPV